MAALFIILLILVPIICSAQGSSTPPAIPAQAQTVQIPRVPRFAKFEASFHLPGASGNPFDPSVNDISVTFQCPHNRKVTVPAFWDGDIWKVRFAPREVGDYSLSVTYNGSPANPIDLTPPRFVCVASARPGFIHVDRKHAQRFVFDNGAPYYPFGCDQAWTTYGLPEYPEMFGKMRDAGLNWARVWMCNWDLKALDWAPNIKYTPPIGTLYLDAARRWDMIFDEADRHGIQIQLTLHHHGQLSKVSDPVWKDNPLNAANPGGFLAEPADFFTNPRAIRLTKDKFRYIVARWGYSDHLLAWELFNEVQNNPELRADFQSVIKWHQEMAAYVRSLDINHHMVTTSYSKPGEPLEQQVDLDFDQPHAYIRDCIGLFGRYETAALKRPVFYGEWGHSGTDWGNGSQSTAFLHDGLWSGVMSTMAGVPQFWYWDLIEKNQWWPEYQRISSYLAESGASGVSDLKKAYPRVSAEDRQDVSFDFAAEWKPTKTFSFDIDPDYGAPATLDDVPAYIQGDGHRDMMPHPLVFHINCVQPTQFVADVDGVSKNGAHLEIQLDGKIARERVYEAGKEDRHGIADTISIDIPIGEHTISISNTGHDWLTIDRITLKNYAPVLAVVAKQNAHSAFFWAYGRARPYSPHHDTSDHPASGTVRFTGLADGTYRITLWDTSTGKPAGTAEHRNAHNGVLAIPITNVTGDMAGWAVRDNG